MRPTGLDRRDQLRRAVDAILASERDGALTRTAETSSIVVHVKERAVATPASAMISLAKDLDASSRAAPLVGPNTGIP